MPDEIIESPAENAAIELPEIGLGTPVIGFNGQPLGTVHEVHPHYLLVGTEGEHTDLEVPAQSIIAFRDGALHVHVTRESSSVVDEQETAHHLIEGEHPSH
jgi:hypothetical protein